MSASVRKTGESGIRVTVLGIIINVVLLAIKLVVGFVTGSVGLVADGVHSGSDMATDLAVLGGIHWAARRADRSHPYGHGRYETLAGAVVAGALILVGAFIAWEAGLALYRGVHAFPGVSVLVVASLSIVAKEWIYRRTVRIARRVGSAALHANAWHHRSDALSSVAVLAGGAGSLAGWGHADQLAGLVVGLMVVTAGGRTLFGILHELTEGSLSQSEIRTIEKALGLVQGSRGWHQLRTRRVGRETFVDVHVLVDPALSVIDAHHVSMDVEQAILSAWSTPVNVVVHVEPDAEELVDHHLE